MSEANQKEYIQHYLSYRYELLVSILWQENKGHKSWA